MYSDSRRKTPRISWIVTAVLVFVTAIILFGPKQAEAASSISVTEINYINSTITLKVNAADTQVYFSDSKKTNWQVVPGEIGSDHTITMDISWIPVNSNYVLNFKADHSTSIVKVKLLKQVTNLKATYNMVKGTVTFYNAGSRTIEWRKKGSTTWKTVNTATLETELSYLCTNGATVYFRLAPVNGTSATNTGLNASKEVTVTIKKKSAAPKIVIDGSAFRIAVKRGMAYRFVNSDGSTTDWTTVSSTTDLLLNNIAASAMYTNASTAQSEVTLQFRTNATSSSQVSKIATVVVPVQEGAPDEDTYGITLNYTSSSTATLQVKAASATVPFEYTIIKKDNELNYSTASWKTISTSASVNLNSTTAPIGSHIYVRKKQINETGDEDFAIASMEVDLSGAEGITYPEAPTVSSVTTLISTAGVCQTTNSSSYLTFHLYSPTSTTVSQIDFVDAYGINKGGVTCKSTVSKNTGSIGTEDKYIITTKITSTSELDTFTEELLYAKITLANSDVITSTDKAGIRLYLYPCTTVNNPTEEEDTNDEYTDSFYRIYMSTDNDDDKYFKFKLDLGTSYVPDSTKVSTYTSQAVEISSMKYDGYTLVKDTDYSVVYGTYLNDDDETIATATVTVKVSEFEKSSLIDETNTVLPLKITLNNGEILEDDIFITLVNTATFNNTPMSWTITEGSLKETKTSVITNSDDSTTTVTEEVITYTLTLSLFDKNYSVAISDVTWGGVSVLGSTTITNGTATIYLSNAKLNKLSTTSSTTNNIVITLSNGFTITNGCKLTILDGAD